MPDADRSDDADDTVDGLRIEMVGSNVSLVMTGGDTLMAGKYGEDSRFNDRSKDELDDLRLVWVSGSVMIVSTNGAADSPPSPPSIDPADTIHSEPSRHPAAASNSRRFPSSSWRPLSKVTHVGLDCRNDGCAVESMWMPKPREA